MIATLLFAAEEANGKWLPSDIKEFYWGAIAFGIVFGLMAWKLFPLLGRYLGNQQAQAISDLSAADEALEQADRQAKELQASLGDPEVEGQKLVAEARQHAEQIKSEGKTRTAQLVEETRARGEAEIAGLRTQAQSDVQAELGTKAIAAAEAVVESNLDPETQTSLIEDYIAKIGANA